MRGESEGQNRADCSGEKVVRSAGVAVARGEDVNMYHVDEMGCRLGANFDRDKLITDIRELKTFLI